jgi:hypothetical protein
MSPTKCFFYTLSLSSLLAGCAAPGARNAISDPIANDDVAPRVSAAKPIQVRIYINTYGKHLGAFDLELHYDSEVGKVMEAEPPAAGPHVQFFKWRRGKNRTYIRLEGFYSQSGPMEERQAHVATVVFHREHDGRCDLRVEPLGVYDIQGKDIKGAVSIHANPPILFYEK